MGIAPKGITKAHLKASNIGEDYWEVDFNNFLGSNHAKCFGRDYLKEFEQSKTLGTGILFAGPPGRGKTTLAVIVLKYISRAGWTCWMTSLGEIVEQIQKGWKEERENGFLETCRSSHFLLIDDVGKEHKGPTGFSSTVFDNLIRYRVQHRLPTFLTTNLTKREIRARYGDALLSLIEGKCKVVEINGDDVRREHLMKKIV